MDAMNSSTNIKYRPLAIRRFRQLRAIFKSLEGGVSIVQACKAANVNTSTLWRWRHANKKLDTLITCIIDSRIMIAEDALFQAGIKGNVKAIMAFLCNRAPERWKSGAALNQVINIQQGTKKDDDRFKEAPRFIFMDCKPKEKQGDQKT